MLLSVRGSGLNNGFYFGDVKGIRMDIILSVQTDARNEDTGLRNFQGAGRIIGQKVLLGKSFP